MANCFQFFIYTSLFYFVKPSFYVIMKLIAKSAFILLYNEDMKCRYQVILFRYYYKINAIF